MPVHTGLKGKQSAGREFQSSVNFSVNTYLLAYLQKRSKTKCSVLKCGNHASKGNRGESQKSPILVCFASFYNQMHVINFSLHKDVP